MKRKILALMMIIVALCFVGCNDKAGDNTPTVSSTLSLSAYSLEIEKGDTANLFAGYNGKETISFKVGEDSDAGVIEIVVKDNSAKISALKSGKAWIDVSVDGHNKTCFVEVIESDYTIKLNRESLGGEVLVGAMHEVRALIYKDGVEVEDEVSWEVSGPDFAKTVDGNIIIVTVKAEGLYKVTAKYSNKAVVEYTFNAINGN